MAREDPVPDAMGDGRGATRSCVNCGSVVVDVFCGGCGQRTPTPDDYALRTFARAAVGYVTNYDARLLVSLRRLFFRPGQLALDHFEGRRASHLDPFRIFVLSNLFAWFVVPHTLMFGFSLAAAKKFAVFPELWTHLMVTRAALSDITVDELSRRIDVVSASDNSVAVLCLVPWMAAGLAVALAGRGHRVAQHLVFTAHLYCIHLCCALLYFGFLLRPFVLTLAAHPSTSWLAPPLSNNWGQHFALAPLLIPYLYVGLQRAYALTARESLWRAVLLGVWACTVTRMFLDVAFALVLLTA